jgi:hypothetical protein
MSEIDVKRKLHHKLCSLVMKYGKSEPKIKHGSMWNLELVKYPIEFQLDDFSHGLTVWITPETSKLKTYIGMDYGGFDPYITIGAYKQLIGKVLIDRWKQRQTI